MVEGWRDRLLVEYWGCCDASGTTFVWRGNCDCYDPYPNLCGVHDCGGTGINDTLLDAPGNTWVALRVINATHNLMLTEYRGRTDPPLAEYANFTTLFDLNADPYQLTNLLASGVSSVDGELLGTGPLSSTLVGDVDLDVDINGLRSQLYFLANCTGGDCFASG